MRSLLSMKDRTRIISTLIASHTYATDQRGTYVQVTFDEIKKSGLPISALKPSYWSGTAAGARALFSMNLTSFMSVKLEILRFYPLTDNDRAVWRQRMERERAKASNVEDYAANYVPLDNEEIRPPLWTGQDDQVINSDVVENDDDIFEE